MKNNFGYWKILFAILAISLLLAFVLSPFASPWPDGLEKVAGKLGFEKLMEGKPLIKSPFPDYSLPGLKNEKLSTALAGFLGTLITFALVFIIGKILKTGKK